MVLCVYHKSLPVLYFPGSGHYATTKMCELNLKWVLFFWASRLMCFFFFLVRTSCFMWCHLVHIICIFEKAQMFYSLHQLNQEGLSHCRINTSIICDCFMYATGPCLCTKHSMGYIKQATWLITSCKLVGQQNNRIKWKLSKVAIL